METNTVSFILPTYNESRNIARLIEGIQRNVPAGWEYEILVVDDNSPDDTLGAVRRSFGGDPRVIPVLRTEERGFAKSIRAGIEKAMGNQVVVMDTDLTHDPAEIPNLLHVGKIYDFVSASRFCAGGRMVDTKHYLISMSYNWLLRILIRTQVQDNLGGYYTFRRVMLNDMPLDEIFFGYGDYYFRLLHFVQKAGFSIVEIPAAYLLRTEGKSKSNWTRMFLTYTLGALRLKQRIRQLEKSRLIVGSRGVRQLTRQTQS